VSTSEILCQMMTRQGSCQGCEVWPWGLRHGLVSDAEPLITLNNSRLGKKAPVPVTAAGFPPLNGKGWASSLGGNRFADVLFSSAIVTASNIAATEKLNGVLRHGWELSTSPHLLNGLLKAPLALMADPAEFNISSSDLIAVRHSASARMKN
jgi:hypothetical protein